MGDKNKIVVDVTGDNTANSEVDNSSVQPAKTDDEKKKVKPVSNPPITRKFVTDALKDQSETLSKIFTSTFEKAIKELKTEMKEFRTDLKSVKQRVTTLEKESLSPREDGEISKTRFVTSLGRELVVQIMLSSSASLKMLTI